MKVSELTGITLDWAVAKCEGKTYIGKGQLNDFRASRLKDRNTYSVSWTRGGPIIEREAITVCEGSPVIGIEWMACDRSSSHIQHGPSYLIAAMRCYVASKLGNAVEIPKELI